MLRRWLPLFAVSVALLHGVPACMGGSDDKLNPQPLPPGDPPGELGEGSDNPGTGDSTSSGSGGAAPNAPDAGLSADADAGDGGDP
ncbi:MAG: hypothetical protein KF764_05995 [Labilithrix sp.]|nr:hypothetical protein [Labilithrix sp.]